MRQTLESAMHRFDFLEELHGLSRQATAAPVTSREHEVFLQQMEQVQEKLSKLSIVDETQLQLQLDEAANLLPSIKAKYPGRHMEEAYRKDPMSFDPRFLKDLESGVDRWTAKRRYLGRQRAVKLRVRESGEIARKRAELTPVTAEVLGSRRKVALYHVGGVEDDQSQSEEFVCEPNGSVAQYRTSAVRTPPP